MSEMQKGNKNSNYGGMILKELMGMDHRKVCGVCHSFGTLIKEDNICGDGVKECTKCKGSGYVKC
jgi:hypothetical protein